jgi:KaiC/GvpD/RAD55 family RecA-like ATPase
LDIVKVDPNMPVPAGFTSFDEYLHARIDTALRKTNAKVLIIDSITALKRTCESSREMMPLMRELRRLKETYGLSILVVANAPKRFTARTLCIEDLPGSKVLRNYADNIFAIGESRRDPALRYIKHITPKCGPAADPSTFVITKIDGNFTRFEHREYAAEEICVPDIRDHPEWDTIEGIGVMSASGMSIRAVADELGLTKTKTHRLLQLWNEFQVSSNAKCGMRSAESSEFGDFPGCEEYDEAIDDPRFDDAFGREDEEGEALVLEFGILESAKDEAWAEYERTGQAPRLDEVVKRITEKTAANNGNYDADGLEYLDEPEPEVPTLLSLLKKGVVSDRFPYVSIDPALVDINVPLKRKLNEYDKVIFVESEDERGKRRVWYDFDSKGGLQRWTRNSLGISGEHVKLSE